MSPTQTEITEGIRKAIAEKILQTDPSTVDDFTLASLDSIGRITLLVEMENEFSVELTNEEYDPEIFSSIQQLSEFVWTVAQKKD